MFVNGIDLGGHVRSHLMNLPLPPNQEELLSPPSDGVMSSSSSGESWREKLKKNIRIVDSEVAFSVDAMSVVLQDRESESKSESETSKNPTHRRRRSRRIINDSVNLRYDRRYTHPSKAEFCAEPEPASSVSDATTEEDVAFCLMMLSRDTWKRRRYQFEEENQKKDDEDEDEKSEEVKPTKSRVCGKYKCDTCHKVFRSYQALGGHRASHKKIKLCVRVTEPELVEENASASKGEKKIHECPVCLRIFSSGQALGGHKRTHMINASSTRGLTKYADKVTDLNLPAPIDDVEISQIEVSAVSDAEFVNPIIQ